jgi:enolase-phosphatase E1
MGPSPKKPTSPIKRTASPSPGIKKQKKNSIQLKGIEVVICDIEGTTTPISFVHDILFPYVLEHVKEFLDEHWEEKVLQEHVDALVELSNKDKKEKTKGLVEIKKSTKKVEFIDSIVKNVQWQMSIDRKIGPLKALQGFMWKSAYESEEIKGTVYQDVLDQFQIWKKAGLKIYIYSSGSIPAQKLLFGFSDKGDLLHYFSGHFDTGIGSKLEKSSYQKILEEIGVSGEHVLFLSDNIKENMAAKAAGMHTINVNRPGNAEILDLGGVEQIDTFGSLELL